MVRAFARMLTALKVSAEERRALVRLLVAHSHAMRVQLRASWAVGHRSIQRLPSEKHPVAERDLFLEPAEQAYIFAMRNPADAILGMASTRLGALFEAGCLDSNSVIAASRLLDRLGRSLRSLFKGCSSFHQRRTLRDGLVRLRVVRPYGPYVWFDVLQHRYSVSASCDTRWLPK